MGNGASVEQVQRKRNQIIDSELLKEMDFSRGIVKMLLLGTSECGKSTVMKQMRILHTEGFADDEFEQQKFIIRGNILTSMTAILGAMERLEIQYSDERNRKNARVVMQAARSLYDYSRPFIAVVNAVEQLWRDGGVQECFVRSSEYHIGDSTQYFFDNLDRIADMQYKPTVQDILRARLQTTEVVEMRFVLEEFSDVGGLRSERKKWIHCFDDVKAVVFVAALSDYDQTSLEEQNTNRIKESAALFGNIAKSSYFVHVSMILFLNKKDIFEKKIRKTPLSIAFSDYKGPQTYDECAAYIRNYFELAAGTQKEIYAHETCATDTEQIGIIINANVSMLIAKNVRCAGLT